VSRRGQRRYALARKLAERNLTRFSLSNAHWQKTCNRAPQRDEHLTAKLGLQPAIDDLAHHSARVSTSAEPTGPLEHVRARLRTMDLMRTRMNATAPRRWAFDLYFPPTSEQLAARTLSKDLVSGCGEDVLIVWGNGGFGPTSHGHASAPNKRLRRLGCLLSSLRNIGYRSHAVIH